MPEPMPSRSPYPATPAYGEGAEPTLSPRPNPYQGGRSVAPGDDHPSATTSGVGLAVTLALAWNLLALLGVLVLGWPAGNVVLLFWAENAVLGLCTLVKVLTSTAPATGSITVNGRPREGTPLLYGLFFTLHYGIFCLVHLVFTIVVAWNIGLELSFWHLGFPLALVTLRYAVETTTTWFGPAGQRHAIASDRAMMQAYPRVVVLHLAVLLGFGLVIAGMTMPDLVSSWVRLAEPLTGVLPSAWRSQGVAVVALLLVIKTVVDVLTTRRVLRRR